MRKPAWRGGPAYSAGKNADNLFWQKDCLRTRRTLQALWLATGKLCPGKAPPSGMSRNILGGPMFVTIDLDAYETLPPRQLRAMLRALRFADNDGFVSATLDQLAMPGLSRSAVHRDLAELEKAGHIRRSYFRADVFLYQIAEPFRSIRNRGQGDPSVPIPASNAGTPIPQSGTTDSRARPFKVLSKEETSERELSLEGIHENLSEGWREAAVAERRRADLPDVDLEAEWRKHVLWFTDRDRPIRLGSWLLWALRTRLDHTNTPAAPIEVGNPPIPHPGNEREQRQARDWVKRGFWLRDGSWGPAPDQPGCTLPPALITWCRQQDMLKKERRLDAS